MMFLSIYVTFVTVIMIIFLKTSYKRRLANEGIDRKELATRSIHKIQAKESC